MPPSLGPAKQDAKTLLLDVPPAWLAPAARFMPSHWMVTSPGWEFINLVGEARRLKGASPTRRASPANAKARRARSKVLGGAGASAGGGVLLLGAVVWLAERPKPNAGQLGLGVLLLLAGLGAVCVSAALVRAVW